MAKVQRVFLSLFLLFAWVLGIHAEDMPHVISEHFTTNEGLPSNNVLCALKDRDGFMWFGTWYGLCRFDGSQFKTYTNAIKSGSDNPPRRVESMVEDGKGNLWLKTVDWKLYLFDRKTERFHAIYHELKQYTQNLQIIKIQRTENGRLLLLTKDKNLLLAHTDEKGIHITKLYDAHQQIDPQTFQLIADVTTKVNNYMVYIGRDYRIFIQHHGTEQSLREAMDKDKEIQLQQENRLQQIAAAAGIEKYAQLYIDHDSLLWVTTTAEGIYCISTPKHFFHLMSLPDNDLTGVRCLYQMRNGNVLVGARSRNAYLYDADGHLLKSFPYNQFGIGSIYHAMEDGQGRLWLSTKGDGLVLTTPELSHFVHYRHVSDNPSSINGNNVYMTFIDSKKHIWVCTLDGGLNLIKEQGGQFLFYHKNNCFKHYPSYGLYNEVRNIVEDQEGKLWVGTIDGLMSFSADFKTPAEIPFTTYRDNPDATFANNDIYNLYRDKADQIWVGAFGGGLQKMGARPLGPREGLRNDVVFSIIGDLQGRLWFATEVGLSCYNQETNRIRNFDQYDGIPMVKMEESSACCLANGQLWMGCNQGILTFSPQQLQTGKADYRTFIVDLVTDGGPLITENALPYMHNISLEHDQNAFTIEFAALNFFNHGSVNYRYRLEGFDRDWRYSGPHQVGSYNEVPPGNYTFIVEAIDDANPTLHSTAQMAIRILPPWWQSWWAYLTYAAFILLVVWLVIHTILKMNRMRNEIYISQRLAKLTTKPEEGDEFIDQLHHIIHKNIPNVDFNINAIAAEMGLSRSAFYKKVKSQTGFAPVDLIKEFRLSHAKELLETTNLSITEIAWKSGFRESSYFGKCFKKRFGLSPREYINRT